MIRNAALAFVLFVSCPLFARADGPADNQSANVRRIPKAGVQIPAEERTALEAELKLFAAEIAAIKAKKNASLADVLPDVEIYYKAVHDALAYEEIFDLKELPIARDVLSEGRTRAAALAKGETPWLDAKGPIVRGYVSKIDGSIQPYGLVIPPTYRRDVPHKYRLDVWCHGRGETLSELNFVNDRRKNAGQFTPENTIVLHPYGRYCNANKFAGEIDTFEAIEAAQKRFAIDERRTAIRGFSMGGAACWQFAVHYPDRWFAATPGAGFSETPEFLRTFQKETLSPPWFERKLYRWYDCNEWSPNFTNLPVIAYSGEKDIQKQAADLMEAALAKEKIQLVHLIGANMGHAYDGASKAEIDRRLAAIAAVPRNPAPHRIRFVTHTLRYDRSHWVRIDGLKRHWERGEVDGLLYVEQNAVNLVVNDNVTAFTLSFGPGESPFPIGDEVTIAFDGSTVPAPATKSDRSWNASLVRDGKWWKLGTLGDQPRKKHGLQGPIDDAFLDVFMFVRPTGESPHAKVSKWAAGELERAIEHWRRHFRGVPRVKNDVDVTEEDMKSMNIVLWGDPQSDQLLGKIAEKLPITWNDAGITTGEKKYSSDKHALIAIAPNPLAPEKYVVLNSSFTYRDYAYLNNARQTPKLPDWAVIDLDSPPDAQWPGKVVDADFFDESWKYQVSPERRKE